jgi:hypothetical protein
LVAAERIDLRVLAPAAFYAPFDLRNLERVVDDGVDNLGKAEGLRLSFAFDVLPAALTATSLPAYDTLLSELARRRAPRSDLTHGLPSGKMPMPSVALAVTETLERDCPSSEEPPKSAA